MKIDNVIFIKIGEKVLQVKLVDNTSTKALVDILKKGDIVIEMNDYSNFEKVGSLGKTLPRNDTYFATSAGDLILYQGKYFVIYYDKNAYTFTRLGKIENISQSQLKSLLGDGDVTVTLSIK